MSINTPVRVVVDVETTGLGRIDRIVEIAIVTLDPETWETVDEFDTLINPERDVGRTDLHGISASMVEAAPTFSEIVPAIASRLHGAVLVAHNLMFDARMLQQEFDRLGVVFDPGNGFCTLRATRNKLPQACDQFGILLSQHHRALADARATAELVNNLRFASTAHDIRQTSIDAVPQATGYYTLRRELTDAGMSLMNRVVSRANLPDCETNIQQYLDMLDLVLDDGVIDQRERSELHQLTQDLGISESVRRHAHIAYLDCIIFAAKRDGIISTAENDLIVRIADQLEIHDANIPDVTPVAKAISVKSGSCVCFTGLANKAHLEKIAIRVGLKPINSMTKKHCNLLVAADVATSSRKAQNARRWHIPIMSEAEFLERYGPV